LTWPQCLPVWRSIFICFHLSSFCHELHALHPPPSGPGPQFLLFVNIRGPRSRRSMQNYLIVAISEICCQRPGATERLCVQLNRESIHNINWLLFCRLWRPDRLWGPTKQPDTAW
jgi:hypothetical protein